MVHGDAWGAAAQTPWSDMPLSRVCEDEALLVAWPVTIVVFLVCGDDPFTQLCLDRHRARLTAGSMITKLLCVSQSIVSCVLDMVGRLTLVAHCEANHHCHRGTMRLTLSVYKALVLLGATAYLVVNHVEHISY